LKTHWQGKAFMPQSENSGHGYNIFTQKKSNGNESTLRTRKMKTWVGPTTIGKNNNDSFHLDYSPFNSGVVHSMHDEIRQVNQDLYICAGYMALGGGPINPGPFVLIGPPSPWVGAD